MPPSASADRGDYSDYLTHIYAFRRGLEARLAHCLVWNVAELAPTIRADMADLACAPATRLAFSGLGEHAAHMIGAAYVAEGSALGARLLVRRAAEIGYDRSFGARHLAVQAEDHTRWPRFLTLLDAVSVENKDDVIEGAAQTFDYALAIYCGTHA